MKKHCRVLAMLVILCLLATLCACGKGTTSDQPSTDPSTSVTPSYDEVIGAGAGGVIEGDATTEMVDYVVIGVNQDVSPAPFTLYNRQQYGSLLYATPIFQETRGASLDEASLWIAKEIVKVSDVVYEIELHDIIYDSKGNHITAEDVIWSYEMSYTEGAVTSGANVKEMTKLSDYRIRVELTEAGVNAIETVLGDYKLCIVSKSWYENASEEERMNDPATTGPYKVSSFQSGVGLVLEVVEDYWYYNLPEEDLDIHDGVKQNVRQIDFRVITESASRTIALESGELDVAQISASDLYLFSQEGEPLPGWNVLTIPGTSPACMYLNMHQGSSPLADNIYLRKAVLTMLDSTELLLAGGYLTTTAVPLYSLAVPGNAGEQAEWRNEEYWAYNLELAQEYMELSGYKPGEVTLTYMVQNRASSQAQAAVITYHLGLIGINIETNMQDNAAFTANYRNPEEWDLLQVDIGGSHVAEGWWARFNPAAWAYGSINFQEDEHLVELLTAAYTTGEDDAINAFHDYLIETASCKGLFVMNMFNVAQDGILYLPMGGSSANLLPNAMEFAEDYVSVHNK